MSISISTMLLNLQDYVGRKYTEQQLTEIPKHLPNWADGTAHEMAYNVLIQKALTYLPNLGAIQQAYETIRSDWEPTIRRDKPKQQHNSDCIVCGGTGRTHWPVLAMGRVFFDCIYCDCPAGYATKRDGKLQIGSRFSREQLPGWDDFMAMRDNAAWDDYSYDDYVWFELQAERRAGNVIPVHELRNVRRLDSSGRGIASRQQGFKPIEQSDVGF